ncbi:MAG: 23S rRNA (pseudouridine(1915)-N(3))-methyltransferase RlmH [Romboutsia sp.]|nr:23S rRNA (pseudouridine(1915)-N(3))-methyltransferase RlmH [Romboutsia sp.]
MIKIICIGKLKENYLIDACKEYQTRIGKYHKINIIELADSNINTEKELILSKIDKKDYNILLDIDGNNLSSIELANKIEKTFISYPNICFIIGGSDGVAKEIKEIVDYKLSFSKLTFPHQLFRVMLLEQIYRCFKINNNETYHK